MWRVVVLFAVFVACNDTPLGTPDGGDDIAVFPSTCANGVKDGDETDVDCGGSCKPCGANQHCLHGKDCASTFCTNNACDAPACSDGVKNGDETDVDCGGSHCPKCGIGKMCGSAGDCQSGNCTNNTCQPPLCMDNKLDGMETDVDCGGATCAKCTVGKMCNGASDCASGLCTNNACQAPLCADGKLDGLETDVDCGGSVCAKCADGKMCAAASDCASAICTSHVCTPAASCTDGKKDGMETDVDCGGPLCGACANGQMCKSATDCASASCVGNVCRGTAIAVSFGTPIYTSTSGFSSNSFYASDLDGDGKVDYLVVDDDGGSGAGVISAYLGAGDGTFKAGPRTVTEPRLTHAAFADFDRDGNLDVLISISRSHLLLFLGKGGGAFQTALPIVAIGTGELAVWLGADDVDGDGHLDVIVGVVVENNSSQSYLHILRGDGKGNFSSPVTAMPGGPILLADVNGDGVQDLLAAPASDNGQSISLALGDGKGGFAPVTGASWPLAPWGGIVVGDFDGDGRKDVFVGDPKSGGGSAPAMAHVLLQNASGGFALKITGTTPNAQTAVAAGDFNLDGALDVATFGVSASLLLGAGDGTFPTALPVSLNEGVYSVIAVDVNRDGTLDLLLLGTNDVTTLLNTGH